jgi:putative NIF3 family GTP cyclohydrolase 1 type 2
MATQQQLLSAFDDLLQPGRFKDDGPNGLQVEGKAEVARIDLDHGVPKRLLPKRAVGARPLRKIAWCSGGAQGYFEDAIAAYDARECGVACFACGLHATERYGAPAVAGHVAAGLGIEHRFVDIDNPA